MKKHAPEILTIFFYLLLIFLIRVAFVHFGEKITVLQSIQIIGIKFVSVLVIAILGMTFISAILYIWNKSKKNK
jgi:hypothetical protein